jgi:hypothetical protein
MLPPQADGTAYIGVLALLGAAEEQVDFPALLGEIQSIAGPKIEPQFRNSLTRRLNIAEKSIFEPVDADANPRSGLNVETVEPFGERFMPSLVLANENLSRRGLQVYLRARSQCDI